MKINLEMFLAKIFVCSLLSAVYLEGKVFAGNVEKKVDEFLKTEIEKRHIPGASVAIVRGGKIVLTKSYGLSNVEQSIKATPDTKYQIGSTTKSFTAMAMMILVENNQISLDEKAAKYLSEMPAKYSEITVRQLLNHLSGVNRDLRQDNADDFSVDEFWKRLEKEPISREPALAWEYSNTGYILLGFMIERVTKKSYGEFLTERIFKPLKMKNTKFLEPPNADKNRAVGYEWKVGKYIQSPYFSGGFGAGGLISTASDMAKWETALSTEKIIRKSSLEQMWMPAASGDGKQVNLKLLGESASYGFGWFLSSFRGHKLVTHGGVLSGFSSSVYRFGDDGLTIIVLCNSKEGERKEGVPRIGQADALAKDIADIYFPKTTEK